MLVDRQTRQRVINRKESGRLVIMAIMAQTKYVQQPWPLIPGFTHKTGTGQEGMLPCIHQLGSVLADLFS